MRGMVEVSLRHVKRGIDRVTTNVFIAIDMYKLLTYYNYALVMHYELYYLHWRDFLYFLDCWQIQVAN